MNRIGRGLEGLGLLTVTMLGGVATATHAQEVEEITVTAQRRASALQDVPVAITVMSDKEIALADFSDTRSLAADIPNLQISSPWGAANTGLFIRGIGNADVNATANAKIGTYQDQVFTGLQVGQNFQLFDLERIEVLKGPQGTLYGKNTTGGALNIVSHQPQSGDNDGYVTVGAGNYDSLTLEAAKSFTLADGLSTRVAGVVNRRDGTAVNLVNGRRQNNIDNYAVRALVRYETDNFDALLRFQRGRNRSDFRQGRPDTRLGPDGASLTGFVNPAADPFKLTTDVDNYLNVNQDGIALVAEWNLGDVALTSVSSYDKAKLRALQDADQSADSLIQIGWRTNSTLFAQELRLTSRTSGPFEYIAGLFFSRERVGKGTGSDFYIFGDLPPDPPSNSLAIKQDLAQRAEQYAAFADFTYHLNDKFSMNGGLRYTIDQKEFWTVAQLVEAGEIAIPDIFTVPYTAFDKSWKKWSGHIGMQYRPNDDIMVYGGFSRGFNGGGFNGGAIVDPGEATAFAPEYLNAYEVGIKSSLFDNRATLNISGFYYDYTNLQVQTITTSPFSDNFIQIIENAANAVIYGSEVELSARVTQEFRVNAAVGLLHTEYKDFSSLVGDASGNRLEHAPTIDFNGSAHYERELAGGKGSIFLRGELSLQSRQYYNSAQRADVSSGGTNESVNVKIGWVSPGENVRVTVAVNNLTNNNYVDRAIDLVGGFGFVSQWYTDPRTYGIQLSYHFN